MLSVDAKMAVTVEKVERMSDDIAEIKESLKDLAKEVQCIKRNLPADLDKRLRGLEGWKSYSTGIAAIVAALVSLLAKSTLDWFRGGIK